MIFKIILICLTIISSHLSADILQKENEINRIADRIWATVGVAFPKPEIIINKTEINTDSANTMAAFNPQNNTIYIGTDFFDYCMNYGEEAFAIILAHEMGHYFNAHKSFVSLSGYIMSAKENDFIETYYPEGDFNKFRELETQADLFAAFHCYSAGYDIREKWNLILDNLNEIVKISEDTYLPLNERKKIAQYAYNKIIEIHPLYKAANQMLITGNFENAAEYYEYIAKNALSGWDIIANTGIAYALAAIEHDIKQDSLILPFLMYDNVLLKKKHNTKRDFVITRSSDYYENMYNKSILKFSHLINIMPEFSASYFAMAALNYYRGNIRIARNYAIKAEEMAKNEYEKQLAIILKAIIFSKNDKNIAIEELKKIKNNPISEYNISLLQGSGYKNPKKAQHIRANENIYGIDINNFNFMINKNIMDTTYYSNINNLRIIEFGNKDYTGQIIEHNNDTSFWIKCLKCNNSTIRGISNNSDINDIINEYDRPDRIIYSAKDIFLIYYDYHIIFVIQDEKVKSRIVFSD